jgi:hypothetical protein
MRFAINDTLVLSYRPMLFAVALSSFACSSPERGDLGELALGLTTQADGVVYRLDNARFTLDGPERREFAATGDDELTLELPSGAYRLTLLEGFQLARADGSQGDAGAPIAAKLVSQNPAPVLISPGQTARVTLRFELADGSKVDTGTGKLAVAIAVGVSDGGSPGSPGSDCAAGLRINELDYEQASSDEAEFIEVVQTGACAAPLSELKLELVNGSDGRPYATYALGGAGDTLAPGERLVLGDANVLATLPADSKRLMLNGSGLQNGPDAVRILQGVRVLDAISYEAPVEGSSEGAAALADEGALALSRCPDGFDTGESALDLRLVTPTPGAANACSDTAP